MIISPHMRHALRLLGANNGSGAINNNGIVLAAGEELEIGAITWLRLMTLGMVEPAGPLRIQLTTKGREEIQ